MNQASWLGCADHRDHIYSLLGHPLAFIDVIEDGDSAMVKSTEKKLVVIPDYHKRVEDVYFELAAALIRQPVDCACSALLSMRTTPSSTPTPLLRVGPRWRCVHDTATGIFGFPTVVAVSSGGQVPLTVIQLAPPTLSASREEAR